MVVSLKIIHWLAKENIALNKYESLLNLLEDMGCPPVKNLGVKKNTANRLLLPDSPEPLKHEQPSPASVLNSSLDSVEIKLKKADAIAERIGADEGGMDCHDSDENITEDNGIRKQQLSALACGSAPQFLKEHPSVFTMQEEVELVKCLKTADKIFDGLIRKEVRKLIYHFAVKLDKLIPYPVWDFDGLADTVWLKFFIERHPSVPIRKKMNSRTSRKLAFTSTNINKLLNCMSDSILAIRNNPVKYCNIHVDAKKNSYFSPENCILEKDQVQTYKSESTNSCNSTPDSMEHTENLVGQVDTCSGNYSNSCSCEVSVGENVCVKEEKDVLTQEEDFVFIKEENDDTGDDPNILFLQKREDRFIKKEEGIFEEERLFLKKEENMVKEEEEDVDVESTVV